MPGGQERRDHYAVLGVPPSASDRQIATAYRKLVRSLHPDIRPADPAAQEELADVLAAYDTLRDAGRRAAYDAARRRPAASRATPGRPVTIRVVRVMDTAAPPVRPAGPRGAGADWMGLSLDLDGFAFLTRILRRWLRESGP